MTPISASTVSALALLAAQASDEITCSVPSDEIRSQITQVGSTQSSSPTVEPNVSLTDVEWTKDVNFSRITVGVLDTGCDSRHPDLAHRPPVRWSYYQDDGSDANGHGTWCCSVINAQSATVRYSICPSLTVRSYKVLDNSGTGTERAIAAGFAQAVADGCTVISMSLGGPSPLPVLAKMIETFVDGGGFVVCASGNGGTNRPLPDYPARHNKTVIVGSVTYSDELSSFSQPVRSDSPSSIGCVGFGQSVLAALPNRQRGRLSGTSMSTPQVAAVIAIYRSTMTSPTLTGLESFMAQYFRRIHRPSHSGVGRQRLPELLILPPSPPPPPPPPQDNRIEIKFGDLPELIQSKLKRLGLVNLQVLMEFAMDNTSVTVERDGDKVTVQFDWTILIPVILDLIKYWIDRRNPRPPSP